MHELFFGNLQQGTDLFGRFKILSCLGASHASGVYLCSDHLSADSQVVLKVVYAPIGEEAELREKFQRELFASNAIDHPNVMCGNDFYSDDTFVAFSMPFIAGGTLADRMEKGMFEIDDVLSIMSQLCEGLQAIHSAGFIHRDLKPENVLLGNDGTVKITDFGIAVSDYSKPEDTDRLIGTMNYLSPEYIEHGQFDPRGDIYALGIIAYEMLTGRLPFESDSMLDSLVMRVKHEPASLTFLRRDCPRLLAKVILRAIARDPEQRYPSAKLMLVQLKGACAEYHTSPALKPARSKKRRRRIDAEVLSEAGLG